MTDDHKTLIAFKIRGSRLKRELWMLTKIMTFMATPILLIGACQVYHCKEKTPKKSVLECVAPMRAGK